MNIRNFLFMNLTGKVLPFANLEDIMLAQTLGEKVRTIIGNPLTFRTKKAQKAKNPSLTLLPVQDLHGYDHAWIGGMGINKWSLGDLQQYTQQKLPFSLKAGTYTFSAQRSRGAINLSIRFWHDGETESEVVLFNKFGTQSQTFTLEADCVSINYAIANFQDGDTITKIQIEQGTTPHAYAPYENICPISGRDSAYLKGCGENLCNMADFTGFRVDVEVSGNTLTVATTSPSAFSAAYIGSSSNLIFPAGTYYVKANCTALSKIVPAYTRFAFRNVRSQVKAFVDLKLGEVSGVMTITEDCFFSVLITGGTADENSVTLENIIISKADAAFVPYQRSNDIAYSFGSTVYGGKIDFTTGVMTVDYMCKTFNGTEEISKVSTGANALFRYASDVDFPDIANNKYACSHFPNAEIITSTTVLGCYAYYSSSQQRSYIQFRTEDVGSTTITAFKTWLEEQYQNGTPVQVYSKLRTPTTIQLTEQEINLLKGINNIWTDGDSIELTYKG